MTKINRFSRPPTNTEWELMFKMYTVCTLFILLKYTVSVVYAINWDNRLQEDHDTFGSKIIPVATNARRREKVAANNLENIPLHLGIFWSALIVQCFANATGHGDLETTLLTYLILIYSCLRFAYTICYLYGWQPFRTLFFVLATSCVVSVACIAIRSAWKIDMSNIQYTEPSV